MDGNTTHCTYENEGFLYINNQSTETFKKGEICDANATVVCPGIIVPIVDVIQNKFREPGDEHLTSFESYINNIIYYTEIQKGIRLRIYWENTQQVFMVSSDCLIYPCIEETYNLSTINFDLLDKSKCYYCVTNNKKALVLTNIVSLKNPSLIDSYYIDEDLAFEHHTEWIHCANTFEEFNETTKSIQKDVRELLEIINTFENGLLFVLKDGRQVEYKSTSYQYYCMLGKPEQMSMYVYYVHCLNKYAVGETFTEYYNSLLEDVRELLKEYPEHTAICEKLSKKILNYVAHHELFDDKVAIESIKQIIMLEPEELIQLLIKY
jgi:hypothetical protein